MKDHDDKKGMKHHVFHPAVIGFVALVIGFAIGWGVFGHKK